MWWLLNIVDMSNNDSFLDALNVASFLIGVINYNENLTQTDKQELMQAFDQKTGALLQGIQTHLKEQDEIIRQMSSDIHTLVQERYKNDG